MPRDEVLGSVEDHEAGAPVEVQAEKQQVVGTCFGLPESGAAADAGGFDLDGAPVGGDTVDAGMGSRVDEPDVE